MADTPLVKVTLHRFHPAAPGFQQGNQSQCGSIQLSSGDQSCRCPLGHRYVDSEGNEGFIHGFNTVFTRAGLGSDCESLNWTRRLWTKPGK